MPQKLTAGDSGYSDGHSDGYEEGHKAGYDVGYNAGYEAGCGAEEEEHDAEDTENGLPGVDSGDWSEDGG